MRDVPWRSARRAPALVLALLLCLAPSATTETDAPAAVVHYLPFPAGQTYNVGQGCDQGPTHDTEWSRHAFDFTMDVGSPICASADGEVVFVKEDSVGPTGNADDNNAVAIRHADGNVTEYLHLEKDGALVEVGQRVFAGDVIARSGNTGMSSGPHLHFGLREGSHLGRSIPCRFADVPGDGLPKKGQDVTSQNFAGRTIHAAFDRIEAAYERAALLGCRHTMAPTLRAMLGPQPPREMAALLAPFGDRGDMRAHYDARREGLLARYRADGAAALVALASAREAGDVAGAVAVATLGKDDFAPLEEVAGPLQAALRELRREQGHAAAVASLRPTLTWRRDVSAALGREAAAREQAKAGKRVRWDAVIRALERTLDYAPTEAARGEIETLVATLREESGAR